MQAKGSTFQPHIVVITDDVTILGDINGAAVYAVVLGDMPYKVASSVIEAVDICFKAFFAFNLAYPMSCQSFCLFLQKSVFNITTSNDCLSSKVNQLLCEIKI